MIDNNFYGFTGVITHAGCWENTRKTSGKNLLKSRVHLAWLSSSFQNFVGIAGLFDTGSCRNLNRRFWLNGICEVGGREEEWQGFFQVLKYVTPLTTLLIFFRNMTPHGLKSSLRQPCGG